MDDWAGGYVADVEYGAGYYSAQAPELANLVALINGYAPRDLQAGYTCCELGCGSATTLATFAAADARGRFYGFDFNPAHIAAGQELAAAAGLDTLTLGDASFAELLDRQAELPDFDLVTLHGVYSWVAPEVKRQIVAFLDAKLKPGGLVYLSYNSLPGWLNCQPLQRLMHDYGRRLPGSSIDQARGAWALVERLAAAKAPGIGEDNAFLQHIRTAADRRTGSYLAHEYMNAWWQPLYFRDVAEDLSAARLGFVGSTNLYDNYPDLCFSEEQRQLIDAMPDAMLRETLRDYCQVKLLRRDIFVRGRRRLDPALAERLLREQWLALVADPARITYTVKPPRGEAELNRDTYQPIIEALAEGPKPIGLLVDLPAVRAAGTARPVEVAGVLTAAGWAVPVGPTLGAPDPRRAGRFNVAVARRVAETMTFERMGFAAPVLRCGLPIDGFDAIMMADWVDGVQDPQALADRIWARVSARNEDIVRDGEPITDPDARTAHLRGRVETFLTVLLPRLAQAGAI